jgi:hypothetical protein
MNLDGLFTVVGAGGVEPTLAAQDRRQGHSVELYPPYQHPPRGSTQRPQRLAKDAHRAPPKRRAEISPATSAEPISRMFLRATNTTSVPSSARSAICDQAALSSRRERLRCTAFPTFLPATKATPPDPDATKATTWSPWDGLPEARTSRTLREGSRGFRLRAGPAPWPACARWSRGLRASSCGCGSHGSSCACVCWAGKFVS